MVSDRKILEFVIVLLGILAALIFVVEFARAGEPEHGPQTVQDACDDNAAMKCWIGCIGEAPETSTQAEREDCDERCFPGFDKEADEAPPGGD